MLNVKFRGKRVDGMGWITGQLFIPDRLLRNAYICPETNYANFAPSLQDGDNLQDEMAKGMSIGLFLEVEPPSIGMSTGLTDKHGKEIFGAIGENGGDIVKCSYGIGKVIFNAGCFMVEWISDKEAYMEFVFSKNGMHRRKDDELFEIIGNATDNPELLEK